MRNLHKFILENNGIEALRLLRDGERLQYRDTDYKNHRIFTLRYLHNDLVPVSIKLKTTLRTVIIIRSAEKQLLQARKKSINSLLDNNAKQIELTRSQITSILPHPSYNKCQEFIEKVKDLRFKKVKDRQVRKFNNLLNKKEGNVTWQSTPNTGRQVTLATGASLWVAGRQVILATRASSQAVINFPAQATGRQVTPANGASPQAVASSQAGRQSIPDTGTSSQAASSQASPAGSALSQAEGDVSRADTSSQAASRQASLANSTLSQAERDVSWTDTCSQAASRQASTADSALSQAESNVSWAGNSQAAPAVRCSDRLRFLNASQADNAISQPDSSVSQASASHNNKSQPNSQTGNNYNSNSQAGNGPLADSAVSQPDSKVSQLGSSQASVSNVTSSASPQETRVSPPHRQNITPDSSSMEESNAKWFINLSSKPLTKPQRCVLAKGPNFVISPKHPPNLEYITAIEAACTKLSQQDAVELRADINWVLRASHPQV